MSDVGRRIPVVELPSHPIPEPMVRAAARLFAIHGYGATSMRQIADAVDLQKASLYHHIPSKEEILYQICLRSLRNIYIPSERAAAGAVTAVETLRSVIRAHVVAILGDRDLHSSMLLESRSLSRPHSRHVIELRDGYEAYLRDVVQEAQRSGEIRIDWSAKELVLALLDMMNWSILWFRPEGGLNSDQVADLFIAVFCEGVLIGTPKGGISKDAGGHDVR